MTCNRGIFSVKKSELKNFMEGKIKRITCTVFRTADGLKSDYCSGAVFPTSWKASDGTLWFATSNGVASINPKDIPVNTKEPIVLVDRIITDKDTVDGRNPAIIQPGAHRYEFHYTALSFISPDRVLFKYRLEGLDDSWIDAGRNRIAYYTDLSPGKYTFRVIACNNDGVWNTEGSSISITVKPPFWKTWWFRIIIGALIVAGLTGLIRYIERRRIGEQIRQIENEKAIERERLRISKDMHDDLGVRVTEIALLTEMARKDADTNNNFPQYLDDISNEARTMVTSFNDLVWMVNPKYDSLENLLEYIAQYTENFFRKSSIRFRLDLPADIPSLELPPEIRHNVLMIMKEAMNNIAKHAGAAEACLGVVFQTDSFTLSVRDNGKGMPPGAHRRFGNGMSTMKSRTEEIGSSLEINSELGKGTQINLTIPICDWKKKKNQFWLLRGDR